MPRRPHQTLPVPEGWPRRVRSATVHAIALARLALTTTRGQTGKAIVTYLAGRRHLPIVELKKAA